VTVIASVLSLGGILLSLVEDVATGRWVSSLGQGFSWRIVQLLIYGGSRLPVARLGIFNRATSAPSGGRGRARSLLSRATALPRDHPSCLPTRRSPRSPPDASVGRPAATIRGDASCCSLTIPTHPSQAADIRLLHGAAQGLAARNPGDSAKATRTLRRWPAKPFLERSARGPSRMPARRCRGLGSALSLDAATCVRNNKGRLFPRRPCGRTFRGDCTFRIPSRAVPRSGEPLGWRIARRAGLSQTLLATTATGGSFPSGHHQLRAKAVRQPVP